MRNDAVPIRRLAAAHLENADRVFRTRLGKPNFRWERDGEARLRRYKADWYAEPPSRR